MRSRTPDWYPKEKLEAYVQSLKQDSKTVEPAAQAVAPPGAATEQEPERMCKACRIRVNLHLVDGAYWCDDHVPGSEKHLVAPSTQGTDLDSPEMVEAREKLYAPYWAARINAHADDLVEAIVATGNDLLAAERAIRWTEWKKMFWDSPDHIEHPLRFDLSTAKRFMSIAKHPVIGQGANSPPVLPSSWTTLYELTKAPPDKLKQAIDGDRVRPTMTGAEAKALVKELKGASAAQTRRTPPPRPPPSRGRWNGWPTPISRLTGRRRCTTPGARPNRQRRRS